MNHIGKYVPNTLTSLSLLSGCIGIAFAFNNNAGGALICIIISACFDFLDGLAARLLNAYSDMGKELDSLADLVAFGVAPAMLIFALLSKSCAYSQCGGVEEYLRYLPFSIPVFSALRLARFNVDERQKDAFLGLPVPAHALFWGAVGYSFFPLLETYGGFELSLIIAIATCITSFLLISEIPMFSLKTKSLAWRGNELRYVLLAGSLASIFLAGVLGIAGAIFLYVLLSVFDKNR
ncbi:MAG: CDP-diacylglycerol--serine O-phosphatidyltransferase [Tannerellaceae bacterium]|nr:CDP-diacylglycerol--serine O-phosphatidyltransferase [Tannerellaceae bacterium]